MDPEVFATLMLIREMFGRVSTLTRTGVLYCTDHDAAWSKTKATDLRGNLTVAKGKGGVKGSGKGGGK